MNCNWIHTLDTFAAAIIVCFVLFYFCFCLFSLTHYTSPVSHNYVVVKGEGIFLQFSSLTLNERTQIRKGVESGKMCFVSLLRVKQSDTLHSVYQRGHFDFICMFHCVSIGEDMVLCIFFLFAFCYKTQIIFNRNHIATDKW